jgi:hypothetical protein
MFTIIAVHLQLEDLAVNATNDCEHEQFGLDRKYGIPSKVEISTYIFNIVRTNKSLSNIKTMQVAHIVPRDMH